MKVTKHDEYLWMITQFGFINCFLVLEEDGVTLVDALTRRSGAKILDVIKGTGRSLKRVLLTHAHLDHVGAIDEIMEATTGVDLLVQERAVPILAGDLTLQDGEPQGKMSKLGYGNVTSPVADTYDDGTQIGSLLAIATPGHAVEHFAFLDRRNKTLIAGDCWQTLGGLAVVGDWCWRFPLPTLGTWHRPTNLESARRTIDFGPAHLAVGHGKILSNAAERMTKAAQRAASVIGDQASR